MSTPPSPTLRIAFATGTSPQKWFRRFSERVPVRLITESSDAPQSLLGEGAADMALVRVATAEVEFPEELHRIRLYEEAWGVAFEKEHTFSIANEIPVAELEGELILENSIDPAVLREILPVVATGAGIALGPRPILRELAKKEIKTADVVDDDHALQSRTSIWLVWPKSEDDGIRQEFVGIVQGRRAGSTRSALAQPNREEAGRKLSAREKTLAKQRRREASRQSTQPPSKRGNSGGRGGRSGRGRTSRTRKK